MEIKASITRSIRKTRKNWFPLARMKDLLQNKFPLEQKKAITGRNVSKI